jgi:hypothetical protein
MPDDPLSAQTLSGGSGNDYIVGGYLGYDQYLKGGIGEDEIYSYPFDNRIGVTYIWGDYEYDNEVTDDDVWGAADYIDTSTANYAANEHANLHVWAGDGDDTVLTGSGGTYHFVNGQNGDDNVRFGASWDNLYVYGDADDDDIAPLNSPQVEN